MTSFYALSALPVNIRYAKTILFSIRMVEIDCYPFHDVISNMHCQMNAYLSILSQMVLIFVLHNPETVNTGIIDKIKGIYEWDWILSNNKRAIHEQFLQSDPKPGSP